MYDSLFKSVIDKDIEEQIKSLIGYAFERLSIVPVQQQNNGSDSGFFFNCICNIPCLKRSSKNSSI